VTPASSTLITHNLGALQSILSSVPKQTLLRNSSDLIFFYSYLASSIGIHFLYRGADKFLARPTSRFILFDGENSSNCDYK